jgi:hypothetical protein
MAQKRERQMLRAPTARYVNYFEVGHSEQEFLFDLGQYHPETSSARLHTRIVTAPLYAKLLSRMLVDSIRDYETQHGPIRDAVDDFDPLEAVLRSIDFEAPAKGLPRGVPDGVPRDVPRGER